jgi:hypothetical protein
MEKLHNAPIRSAKKHKEKEALKMRKEFNQVL